MIRAITLGALIVSSVALAQNCPSRGSWPTTDWPSKVDQTAAAAKAEIAALEEYMFTLEGKDEERKGIRTDGLLIVKGGAIVYEKYARGWKDDKRHILWSCTKTLSGMMAGIAVQKGLVDTSQSICTYNKAVPEKNCAITVENLLQMASGLDWAEEYENKANQESSVLALFYGEGQADGAKFVASHDRAADPGTKFNYSTGESMLLVSTVQEAVKDKLDPQQFPWTEMFDKVGMKSVRWERDGKNHFYGGSHSYMTLRDMARFGYFMLNDGCWNGERILPEGWMANSTTPNPVWKSNRGDETWEYGRQIWLNRPLPEISYEKPWKDLPDDTYGAVGHWGQYIYVVPSLDLVVVRMGDDRDASALDENEMIKRAIAVAGVAP
ncbi:MAG: serine hydrolase domain-containing protein [Myxococcaceae bacterium]